MPLHQATIPADEAAGSPNQAATSSHGLGPVPVAAPPNAPTYPYNPRPDSSFADPTDIEFPGPGILRDPIWPAQWDIATRRAVYRAALHLRTALSAMVDISSHATRDLALAMTHTEDAVTRLREYVTVCTYHETARERANDAELSTLDFLFPRVPKPPNP